MKLLFGFYMNYQPIYINCKKGSDLSDLLA
ncbi:MAG: hypothetical protein ACJAS1_001782 [Oleiphilaceae bacterium]